MEEPLFDASSTPDPASGSGEIQDNDSSRASRPFLGIRFKCCRTYGRIYRNENQTAYEGQCPKCRARVSVPIGNGGTSSRFFDAG